MSPISMGTASAGHSAVQHAPLNLCSLLTLLAATSQSNHAQTHELQLSGPTVYSLFCALG